MDMNQKSAQFLNAYSRDEEVEGGLVFNKALAQAKLDFSQASLLRLDVMLDQMRVKVKPDIQSFTEDTAKQNFCLMLAFYLGELISKLANKPVNWYSYPAVLKVLPSDSGLPKAFFSQIAAVIEGNLCLPLSIIQEKLFAQQPGLTCQIYVNDFLKKIASSNQDNNKLCQEFLTKLAADAEFAGGIAFKNSLKPLNLDYSLASLGRIDVFLNQVKKNLPSDYEAFVNKQDSHNFLLLLGFYLGATIARLGQTSIKWLDFNEAKVMVPELNFHFESAYASVIGNRIYFPLWVITESLFANQAEKTCLSYAEEILAINQPTLLSIRKPQTAVITKFTNPLWATAIHEAGFFAAYGMYMVADGEQLAPTILKPTVNGQKTLIQYPDSSNETIKRGQQVLVDNSENLPFQLFLRDGYANLATGRTDSLVIELRAYVEPTLKLTLALPYRHAENPLGFAIYSPKLLESTAPEHNQPELFQAFYDGIRSYQGFAWDRYLDESI